MDDAASRDHQWGARVDIRLPELASEMDPLVRETARNETSWERRIELPQAFLGAAWQ